MILEQVRKGMSGVLQACNLNFSQCQSVRSVRAPALRALADRLQLEAGAFREILHTRGLKELIGSAQLRCCFRVASSLPDSQVVRPPIWHGLSHDRWYHHSWGRI
jgi:hypothetical protein